MAAAKPTGYEPSPELLAEADELTRFARTITVWADFLRDPLYSRGTEPPETASAEERAAFEAWQRPAREERAAFVQEIRGLLPPLREAFAGPSWRSLVLWFCQIEGAELREARKRGERPTKAQRLTTAARVLCGARAPATATEDTRIARVEALIRAYSESSGGSGKLTLDAVDSAALALFGAVPKTIQKAETRRKAKRKRER